MPTAWFISRSSSLERCSSSPRLTASSPRATRCSSSRKACQSSPTRLIWAWILGSSTTLMLRSGLPSTRSRWAASNSPMVVSRAAAGSACSRSSSASLVIFWLSMRWAPATLIVSGDTDMLRYRATEAVTASRNIRA